ncbi:FYVE zinc finger protein [Quillaja saponaria]|uniref:FYVE zinc finger protein n=1 Tax=Quillaja saponaria TaxID=32244 RepID=A0AAD7P9N2_QUISA|nr:FYVE zinc finger protein [Quillaja saponaria]
MLEKIGLPAKPSVRGSNWVVDASHCQGCSSQFTFINRKHHCRRCGGLFCNSCTQQRMFLRGQGDSPVRICEPCKKLEDAARFEMRHGHKNRAGRGSSKLTSRHDDEVLNQTLGHEGEQSLSLGNDLGLSDCASSSNIQEVASKDGVGGIQRSLSVDEANPLGSEMGSNSPDQLRQQALEEKKQYRILKGEGKSEEALRAFKRGKELERQAGALEISLRKSRKKVLSSDNMSDTQNKDGSKGSGGKPISFPRLGKEKDDLAADLKELGWSDMDLCDEDKKSANVSLEGELFSLVTEVSQKTGGEKNRRIIDKTEVVALKKKALMLKREGKLAEAKEELRRAKILEKQLEEQELLAEAEDSDDELSALIRGMNNDEEAFLTDQEQDFNFDHLLVTADDLSVDGNFDVTDEDMKDPEISAALKSLGWTEDSDSHHPEGILSKSLPVDREAMLIEIQSLKREALNKKRAGNAAEAMAWLKKAKVLERDLESFESEDNNYIAVKKGVTSQTPHEETESIEMGGKSVNGMQAADSTVTTKSRLVIQKELLTLKKNALTLRRAGKLNEAEEQLNKCAALEHQLEEMDKASKAKATRMTVASNDAHSTYKQPDIPSDLQIGEGVEDDDVTDQDMSDPTYLSLLRNLGWNDDNNSSSKPSNQDDNHFSPISVASVSQSPSSISVGAPRRSKFELQRELLVLKRKALALRREGKTEDAEEVLKMAKELETKIAETEAPNKEGTQVKVEAHRPKDKIFKPPIESAPREENDDVTEKDMHDPALRSMLINLGWKDEESEPATMKEEPHREAATGSGNSRNSSLTESSSGTSAAVPRSNSEIQREILVLKRKALALRRKGETEQAEEILRMAKTLEVQMEDLGAPKKELLLNALKGEEPIFSDSSIVHEKHGNLADAMEKDKRLASSPVGPTKNVAGLSIGFGRTENETSNPTLKNSNDLIPVTYKHIDPLSVDLNVSYEKNSAEKLKTADGVNYVSSPGLSMINRDLLTGDDWSSPTLSAQNQRKELHSVSAILSFANPPINLKSWTTATQDQEFRENFPAQKREALFCADVKTGANEADPAQEFGSQNQISLRQEILAHKRKAVALKREGKLSEAREELRQAKLLEEKCRCRDRFKLQQESLAHKRQALKLRREGRTEEAEAEFELAKSLETQLEEAASHDSSKTQAQDDATVEDFLDPLLLSALKAIGVEDANVVPRNPGGQKPIQPTVVKSENINHERSQLEERIKAEKMKAVNLKRSGKQAEALDALRRAKLFEKKLEFFNFTVKK